MKDIVSWTQTYGDKRMLNINLLQYDILGNYLRDKCEYIIFSFHNCPDKFIKESIDILKDIYNPKKLLMVKFDNCSYLDCYKHIVNICKKLKCTDILQIQDDQHGVNTKENINNLKDVDDIIETYKQNPDIHYLHIFGEEGKPKPNLVPLETITVNNVEIYKYDSRDFQKCNIYAWNDGTYFININLIEKLLHIHIMPDNVWGMEMLLKHIFDTNRIFRYDTNKLLFRASNLYGQNVDTRLSPEENLYRFFGETQHWDTTIKNIIKSSFSA